MPRAGRGGHKLTWYLLYSKGVTDDILTLNPLYLIVRTNTGHVTL